MQNRKHVKLVHEGKYVAEVEIEIIDSEKRMVSLLELRGCI